MRSITSLMTAALLPALMLAGCHKAGSGSDGGSIVSNYTVDRSVKGKGWPTSSLELWGGDPFLVTIWSSDCKDCESQLANLDALAAQGKYKVMVIDIDPVVKPGSPDAFTPFLAAHKYKALATKQIKSESEVNSWEREPGSTALFDKKGAVWNMKGTGDFQSADVQKLLGEAEPK